MSIWFNAPFFTVASFLNANALATCRRVCKNWKALVDQEYIWQRMVLEKAWKQMEGKSWKETYIARFPEIRFVAKEDIVLEGHAAAVLSVHLRNKDTLFSFSHDGILKCWNICEKKTFLEYKTHERFQQMIQLKEGEIIARSDQSLSYWSLKDGSVIKKLSQFLDSTYLVGSRISQKKYISWYTYSTVRVWDLENNSDKKFFKGTATSHYPQFADVSGSTLISYSKFDHFTIWDFSSKHPKDQIKWGKKDAVTAIALFDHLLAIGGATGSLYILDLKTKEFIFEPTIHKHWKAITCLQFVNKDILITGGNDNGLQIWSILDKKSLSIFRLAAPVTCISYFNYTLAAGCNDGSLRVWKF